MDKDSIYADLRRENERLKRVVAATADALISKRKRDSDIHWRKSDDEAVYICSDRHVLTFGEMARLILVDAQERRYGEISITDDAVMRLAERCGGKHPKTVLRAMTRDEFDLMVKFDPLSEGGYRCISSSVEMQRKYQMVLDTFYQERVFEVRSSLRTQGWTGVLYATELISPDGTVSVKFEPSHITAGRSVVGGKWFLMNGDVPLFSVQDLPFVSAVDIATAITAGVAAHNANKEIELRNLHNKKEGMRPRQW